MITVVRVPDGYKDVDFTAHMSVEDAIDAAGYELKDNEEVRVNNEPINGNGLDTELRDNDVVLIVKDITGN